MCVDNGRLNTTRLSSLNAVVLIISSGKFLKCFCICNVFPKFSFSSKKAIRCPVRCAIVANAAKFPICEPRFSVSKFSIVINFDVYEFLGIAKIFILGRYCRIVT